MSKGTDTFGMTVDTGFACAPIRPDGQVARAATAAERDPKGPDAAPDRWIGPPRA